ncbi:Protein DA1-like protein [Dioscorea alata]|uniref:Protein DA1-like protein n=1 Tax=Dioscorea alata TaxID=55571 RepID=A0ACB7U9N9_DIOAL|nr:Protein DA1-like protein [Dioscorea alata]
MAPSRNARRCVFIRLLQMFCGRSPRCSSRRQHPTMSADNKMSGKRPQRSVDDQAKAENEELDHAIALSLAEDDKRSNGFKDHGGDGDEDLAKAIQESLNMSSSCHPDNTIQFLPRGDRVCGGCNRQIGNGYYMSCKGIYWHAHCFCCHGCGQPIQGTQFYLSGRAPYHTSCYKETHHPKCDVCHEFIPTCRAGLIEYKLHPYWKQKYCPSHEHDNTLRCCSCERMESSKVRYVSLEDGRSLCLECLDTAILDTDDCQHLYHSIRDFYEGMNMKIDQQIPMLLVERQALNEAIEGEKEGNHRIPETRGLCLSEEQTVSNIIKRPRIYRNQILGATKQPQKLIRICQVTAILALYGLPRLLTGAILAHELMHAWLRLKGYRDLSPEVEEGICQVLSHMWLESEVMLAGARSPPALDFASSSSSSSSSSSWKKTRGKSDTEKELGKFFLHQIANDVSSAYGEGFRAANKAVNKHGLRKTLEHIRLTGTLPI